MAKKQTRATLANMQKHYDCLVLAWSPVTGEEVSADPADYFYLKSEDCLQDSEGNDMILVYKTTEWHGV